MFGWKFGTAMLAMIAFASSVAAADSLDQFAQRLIEMRSKVETLHDAIDAKRQDHKSRMNSLAGRRTHLESEIQGKELQLRQLRQAIAEEREKNRVANESAAAMTPTFNKVAQMLTTYLDTSVPFKRSERQQAVTQLMAKVEKGDLSAPQGLNRLWSLYEDEFRITKENGLFRQEITIDGNAQLSDVIRLGTMMLFFKTGGGVMGFAQKKANAWDYVVAEGADAQAIDALFEAFERQVRSGFFTLPNALGAAQ